MNGHYFQEAFGFCREAGRPITVKIDGDGEFKLYPSGKAVRLTTVPEINKAKEEKMRIVMQNQGNGRKDAVYVLDVPPSLGGEYALTAYWGRWDTFLCSKFARLRWQSKYRGDSKPDLMGKVQRICSEKMRKGYRVQEGHSILPEWPILPFGQNWKNYPD